MKNKTQQNASWRLIDKSYYRTDFNDQKIYLWVFATEQGFEDKALLTEEELQMILTKNSINVIIEQ